MKRTINLVLLLLLHTIVWSQNALVKDLDGDAIADTVLVDRETSRVICQLSTQSFKRLQSKTLDLLVDNAGVRATRSGFEFTNNYIRAGNACQFRYDVKSKRIQLIGMSRYEFGNAANDGSGESSVNLLTSDYIGNWNYFDYHKEQLVKMPTIKSKIPMGKIYLEDFNDVTVFTYIDKCVALYEKHKQLKGKGQ